MFSKAKTAQLKAKFSSVNTNDIADSGLRAKAAKLKAKQGGFTLLELLVVVAILAAIAGTATIALQDTDARASAAAHVAMMDELNKGIRTFRVLNKNVLPTGYDSLIQDGDALFGATAGTYLSIGAAGESLSILDLPVGAAEVMNAGGIDSLQYINTAQTPADSAINCTDLEAVVASRANAVVAGNIFMSPDANGCGYTWSNIDSDTTNTDYDLTGAPKVAIWTGGYERVLGAGGAVMDSQISTATGALVVTLDGNADTPNPAALLAVGLGPSSSLFNANDLGGLTSVPVYRHVSGTEYNRFIALFNVGTLDGTPAIVAGDQVVLTAIVDGAGDTKEEELGEWDGTRNTI